MSVLLVAEGEARHTAAWCGAPEQDRALPHPGEITSVSRPEEGEHVLKARLLRKWQPFQHRGLLWLLCLFCSKSDGDGTQDCTHPGHALSLTIS